MAAVRLGGVSWARDALEPEFDEEGGEGAEGVGDEAAVEAEEEAEGVVEGVHGEGGEVGAEEGGAVFGGEGFEGFLFFGGGCG